MSMESDLYALMAGVTGISTLVGTRIYPVILPENATLPAIRYQRITSSQVHSHDGASGFETPLIQIDCYAKTYPEAVALAQAVKTGIDGFNGYSPQPLFSLQLQSDSDAFEEVPRMWRRTMDFQAQREF